MIKEISYQTDAVNELVEKTIKLLDASGSRKKLVVQGTDRLRQDRHGQPDAGRTDHPTGGRRP